MINPHAVFVADARPALNVPQQRSAYVFGAAHPLGEALLAQILASSAYSRVYVSTTAPLPATVAHLQAVLHSQAFSVQDQATAVDCVFVVSDAEASTAAPHHLGGRLYGFSARNAAYAPLAAQAVPELLRTIAGAVSASNTPMRWLLAAPESDVTTASTWVSAYCAHTPCVVYGLPANARAGATHKAAYRFKPEGNTVLDRLGVWVLNLLSGAVHGMLNPQQQAPLSAVKTAQRLAARFAGLAADAAEHRLSPSDLAAN
jgi:hypothetical protein